MHKPPRYRRTYARLTAATVLALGAGLASTTLAGPAVAVPGLVRAAAVGAGDSASTKETIATCPVGTRVLGGGGAIQGGDSHVRLTRLQALGSTDQFAVGAAEDGAYAGSWLLFAYAICGQAPAGLQYVSFHSPSDSDGHKTGSVECPAGTTAISYGGRTTGGGGHVVLTAIGPTGGLTGTKVIADEDEDGLATDWSMWAYAVCANPLPGQQLVYADALPADSVPDTVTVACPSAKRVHGLGSTITSGFGEVHHHELTPNATLTSVTVIAVEDASGAGQNWWTRGYAVCAY